MIFKKEHESFMVFFSYDICYWLLIINALCVVSTCSAVKEERQKERDAAAAAEAFAQLDINQDNV